MQKRSKHTFVKSKMNKDLDARLISAGEYRDANNVSVSRSDSSDVGALENILGNEFLNDLQKSGSTPYQVIGWYVDQTNDRIFIFCTNYEDNSSNIIDGIESSLEQTYAPYNTLHKIVYFNTKTNTSSTIVSGRFLNFSINSPILNTNMIENLLFFTDNRNQPRKINVDTAIADPSYYFNEDHISVAKYYPYQPIQLYDELVVNDCVFVEQDIDNRPITGITKGYSAIYPYFMIDQDSLSQEIIDTLSNNIGVRATLTDASNNIWDFRIAWFQLDGDSFSPIGGDLFRQIVDNNSPRKYLIFPNRDLSSANIIKYTQATFPADGDFEDNKYTIRVYEETTKNVSEPWSADSAGKLKITSMVGNSRFNIGDASTTWADTPNFMFLAGTRSLPVNPTATTYTAYFADPGTKGGGESNSTNTSLFTFYIPNAFPTNSSGGNGISKNAYMRVKHPKIPDTDYVVIQGAEAAPIPSGDSPSVFRYKLLKYSSLSEGGTLATAPSYGLAAGDVLDIYYPNKYYNSAYPGDPSFIKDKFVRFAYRFKYDDGEYSVISPFSQSVFIPKQQGYFQKRIGNAEYNSSNNNFIPQEQTAGQNTIVDFFVNSITEANVKIPLDFAANELKNKLKVHEIDIIYKESDALALKVVETLDVDDYGANTDNFITYKYQNRKPIKTLPSDTLGRVYDNVPIRALTQSTSGNRIIYGNFIDRHTSPLTLDYMVGYSRKFPLSIPSTESTTLTNRSIVSYPTHTVKHNRTYQVGIVMSDRYGRSTDVILSSIQDETVVVDTGLFTNNPITFGGSTLYIPYSDLLIQQEQTAQADILTTQRTLAGVTDWPGDSIKLRWNTAIPGAITSNPGYPGLYEEVIATIQFDAISGANWQITSAGDFAKAEKAQPGMFLRWDISGITYETEIKAILKKDATPSTSAQISIEPVSTANAPAASSTNVVIYKKNPLGFSSYRVVVKQNEQDYYNVYLPSLLDGNPVVKPFKLNIKISSEGVGTVNSTVDLPAADPKTFLLLEGMVFTSGGTEYVITNILNNDNFTVEPATALADTDVEFTTRSSKNTINVTTLLTDNANKVPPALIETTPVQQQYGSSDVKLIPRVALQANYTAANNPFFTTAGGNRNRYIYPGLETLKVRSLGNFESLFVDSSYAGLWQANTDPPTGVIENKFQLGRDAETVLPASKEPLIFSCYETTPTVSEIDIFYETSTAFDIYTLNQLFTL